MQKKTQNELRDLNARSEAIKLLEEKTSKTLFDINYSNISSGYVS